MDFQNLRARLLIHYFIGSIVSVFGFGVVFIFHTLEFSSSESLLLFWIIVFSFINMIILEFLAFSKQIKPVKTALTAASPSLVQLRTAYKRCLDFPILTFRRIMLPHFLGVTVPATFLVIGLIFTDRLNVPYVYVPIACAAAFLVASMHGMIEFFLTTRAMLPTMRKLNKKASLLFHQDISQGHGTYFSIRKKFFISAMFLSIFPTLLFAVATIARLNEYQSHLLAEYTSWAAVVIIIAFFFAVLGSILLTKDILAPLEQLEYGLRGVQNENIRKLENYYSDEFSKLISGFNHMADSILEKQNMNEQLNDSFFTVFAATLDARDPYTAGHSLRVAEYAQQIGRKAELSKEKLSLLKKAALLHDIGKIGIRDEILLKDGKLTVTEYETIKLHPLIGAEILQEIKPKEAMEPLLPGVRHHHERFDGDGYPDGLAGYDIPEFGRILAVADGFDAMTSDRNYRKGMPVDKALRILRDGKGSQWDPYYVDLFLACIKETELKKAANQ
ncbi:HD-GYP domain-containing protein [Sediminibacillus albus]|uniref:HDIG domain-containing protein n=1 Tax=Sediminibacillus albus TaxID=407036 RepID=A0A1G8WGL9_9BACI|nr:HD domain-containing phosphohydrolase [Sediminibacillus albus]SDJ76805.1 HDIG domain-containing protein [Sediminibacillus albus]